MRFRHRVDKIVMINGRSTGVGGIVLAPSVTARGEESNRDSAGEFALSAEAVIVTSGGIGGNHELVRENGPRDRLGEPPTNMISSVPAHVDGRMIGISEKARAAIINSDRMWHYTKAFETGIRSGPGTGSASCRGRRPSGATRGQLPASAVPAGFRHAVDAETHHDDGPRLYMVRAQPVDHREGVRAVGIGAESGPDRQEHCQGAAAGQRREPWRRSRRSSRRAGVRGARFDRGTGSKA